MQSAKKGSDPRFPGTARSRSAAGRRLARLTLQIATRSRGIPAEGRFRRWAEAALERPAQFTIRVVGEAEARRLNRDFRGKRYPPNVLTFRYEAQSRALAGDIVLCAPVIAREAKAQKKSLQAHYAHLSVHGLLHLQGYDHEFEREARLMERRETRILKRLGYPDPYGR